MFLSALRSAVPVEMGPGDSKRHAASRSKPFPVLTHLCKCVCPSPTPHVGTRDTAVTADPIPMELTGQINKEMS